MGREEGLSATARCADERDALRAELQKERLRSGSSCEEPAVKVDVKHRGPHAGLDSITILSGVGVQTICRHL